MKPAVQKVRVESRNLSSIAEIRQDQPKPLQKNEDILVTLDSISPIKTSKADKQIESVSAPAKKAKVQMPAALTETPGVEQSGETGRDEALNEVIGVLPPTQEVTDNTQATAALSDRCSDAAKEAEKARLSPSKSNKLFYFRRAMRLCPDAPEFHLEVGYLYAALGRNDDARIEFDRVVELDPENVEAREQLSLLAQ
jgi:tetratricopeptide (TPR) repeat protein